MKISSHLPVLLIMIFLLASCNEKKEDKQTPAEKINIENKEVRIDYTDTGKGDTVLLFVHGWGINKTYWIGQESFFKGRYRIVTVDLPGFGMSGKNRNDWSVYAFASDVDTVIAKLDLKNVILVGHSMSGDVVLEAAIHAPKQVIGLIGVDNFKSVGEVPDSATKKAIEAYMIEMSHHYTALVTDYFNKALFSPSTDTAIKMRVLNDVLHTDSLISIEAIRPNDFHEVDKLKAYNRKLYLINSDFGKTDSSALISNKIPYEIFYTPGTGHYAMVEKEAEFNALLERIIKEIGK